MKRPLVLGVLFVFSALLMGCNGASTSDKKDTPLDYYKGEWKFLGQNEEYDINSAVGISFKLNLCEIKELEEDTKIIFLKEGYPAYWETHVFDDSLKVIDDKKPIDAEHVETIIEVKKGTPYLLYGLYGDTYNYFSVPSDTTRLYECNDAIFNGQTVQLVWNNLKRTPTKDIVPTESDWFYNAVFQSYSGWETNVWTLLDLDGYDIKLLENDTKIAQLKGGADKDYTTTNGINPDSIEKTMILSQGVRYLSGAEGEKQVLYFPDPDNAKTVYTGSFANYNNETVLVITDKLYNLHNDGTLGDDDWLKNKWVPIKNGKRQLTETYKNTNGLSQERDLVFQLEEDDFNHFRRLLADTRIIVLKDNVSGYEAESCFYEKGKIDDSMIEKVSKNFVSKGISYLAGEYDFQQYLPDPDDNEFAYQGQIVSNDNEQYLIADAKFEKWTDEKAREESLRKRNERTYRNDGIIIGSPDPYVSLFAQSQREYVRLQRQLMNTIDPYERSKIQTKMYQEEAIAAFANAKRFGY